MAIILEFETAISVPCPLVGGQIGDCLWRWQFISWWGIEQGIVFGKGNIHLDRGSLLGPLADLFESLCRALVPVRAIIPY